MEMSVAATSSAVKPAGSGDIDGDQSPEMQTFWCHECDMSVSLSARSRSPPVCPHCFGDFLELMDSPLCPSLFPSDADDNFLLDGPYLRRIIQHLSSSAAGDRATDAGDPSGSLPASKSSVDALPTIRISSSLLDLDPFLLCAVCKDHFVPADDAKQLPCKHLYHPSCILPWLAHHNSCPVCRFRLPAEERDGPDCGDGESAEEMVLRAGDDEDWFDYASTLRYIARRHNLVFSATQVAEDDDDRTAALVARVEEEGMDDLAGGDGDATLKVSSSSASENSR